MTEHRCKTFTPGCYRCDLNKDLWFEHQSERIKELELENNQLLADMREALSLLSDVGDVMICDRCCENPDTVKGAVKWEEKCDALLKKHNKI